MIRIFNSRQAAYGVLFAASVLWVTALASAQPPRRNRDRLQEPVYRSARTPASANRPVTPAHPLDPAIQLARDGLVRIRRDVKDYTATMVKRERINGQLTENEYMYVKIRNRKVHNGRVVVPFSVYMRFLQPKAKAGREIIYVEGRNNNKLQAHGTGVQGWISVSLDPRGGMAMAGNRYPLTDIGIENLVEKLIERGSRERQYQDVKVQFYRDAKMGDRSCLVLEVKHPNPKPHFEFCVARVFIDNELQVPIRYAAYKWPEQPGGQPIVDEEYTYMDMKLNVGLTDKDFDPGNPKYEFPRLRQ